MPLLGRALGSRNRFSATSVDQLPHMLASLEMFGHQLLMPVPDVDRTDFFLVLGANPLVSNGSIMTAPDMRRRLKALKDRGGTLVVIDPRRSETAAVADEHLFIPPGGDAFLLLGMLHTLFAEKRITLGAVAPLVDGVDTIAQLVAPFSPARVAVRAGINAARNGCSTSSKCALALSHWGLPTCQSDSPSRSRPRSESANSQGQISRGATSRKSRLQRTLPPRQRSVLIYSCGGFARGL